MSDSVRPHRRQPTRLPCPWDSPGKNTGVGCHFLLQCMKVKVHLPMLWTLGWEDPLEKAVTIHSSILAREISWTEKPGGLQSMGLKKSQIWVSTKQQQYVYAAAKSLQLCPTLWDPIYNSPPGSPVPGILQAGILEWVAISFSNAWQWKVKVKSLSHVQPSATPWTAAYQAPPPMGFSRQEYWSGLPLY